MNALAHIRARKSVIAVWFPPGENKRVSELGNVF